MEPWAHELAREVDTADASRPAAAYMRTERAVIDPSVLQGLQPSSRHVERGGGNLRGICAPADL
jgi:hypothetical protein